MNDLQLAIKIAKKIKERNGSTYFVGGYVRDLLLKKDNKDIDIEIHGLSKEEVVQALNEVGEVLTYGDSFEIFSLRHSSLDISYVEKKISLKQACMRRDFTINALMMDVLTNEIIDYFDGQKDLNQKIIKVVSDQSFIDDPLRVLRMAQFAARFEFNIDQETLKQASKMDLSELKAERVLEEVKKVMLKASKPSIFFEILKSIHQLEPWFKELLPLIDLKQHQIYHMEKDVFTHTMMVLDEASKRKHLVEKPFYLMMSALCHDFGKAITTTYDSEYIHSYQHEIKGLPLVEKFITRLSNDKKLKQYVLNMTQLHMLPNTLAMNNSKVKKTNRLYYDSVDPLGLIQLAISDDYGRISGAKHIETQTYMMDRLQHFNEMMKKDYVKGEDLIKAGLKPGANFKEILDYALKLRLAEVEKEEALKQTLAYARKINKKIGND